MAYRGIYHLTLWELCIRYSTLVLEPHSATSIKANFTKESQDKSTIIRNIKPRLPDHTIKSQGDTTNEGLLTLISYYKPCRSSGKTWGPGEWYRTQAFPFSYFCTHLQEGFQ